MRKINLTVLAALGLFVSLVAASTSAAAQYYTRGGVVPCSADDYSFRGGRWVSNCGRRSYGGGYAVRSHNYSIRMCHDWVMRNGVKVYTGPAYRC